MVAKLPSFRQEVWGFPENLMSVKSLIKDLYSNIQETGICNQGYVPRKAKLFVSDTRSLWSLDEGPTTNHT